MIILAIIIATISATLFFYPIYGAVRFFIFHKNTGLNGKNILIALALSLWFVLALFFLGE